MVEINELLNIVIDLICLLFLFIARYRMQLHRYRLMIYGIILIVLSHIFSVIETFILPDFFNVLEHLLFNLAMVVITIGIYRYFLRKRSGS